MHLQRLLWGLGAAIGLAVAFASAAPAQVDPAPASTSGLATGGGLVIPPGPIPQEVAFGFVARSTDDTGPSGHCNVIDQATDMHIVCLDVFAYVEVGPHASFWGRARVNNAFETSYKIDVDDGGEAGAIDTFAIVLASGYALAGTVVDGDIQVGSRAAS